MRLAVTGAGGAQSLIARLGDLDSAELAAMYGAAAEATACLRDLAAEGDNPVTAALKGASTVDEWMHYPPGDVVDPSTRSRYYYHSHSATDQVPVEHGHFHTFVRAAAGDAAEPTSVTHLIGISMDAFGRVVGLFTTNRWVTGEVWSDADRIVAMLDRFEIDADRPSRGLNRWVTAIVRLFRPQIVDLIRARDQSIARFQVEYPGRDVLEDRRVFLTSAMPVDFLAQIQALETVLAAVPHLPGIIGTSAAL